MKDIDIQKVISIAKQAGKEILKIYEKDFSVKYKDDKSPLTEADTVSNNIITNQLTKLYPNIHLLSEETKQISYNKRKNWKYFFRRK